MTDDHAMATGSAVPAPSDTGAQALPPVGASGALDRRGSWVPTWPLVSTKLMVLLTLALPFLVLGIRLLFHAIDPKTYGPAGTPSVFIGLCGPIAQFGFIAGAALGATAGSSDLTEGVFRHLVITGRSRVALYFARIPAGLAILVPLVGLAFASVCLVTAFAGTPQPRTVNVNGIDVPVGLNQSQLETWLLDHPRQLLAPIVNGPGQAPAPVNPERFVQRNISTMYQNYVSDLPGALNPSAGEMVKIGLWIELQMIVGFLVGLGLGSLLGQRTVVIILLVGLQIIITPILANTVIPHFLDGQRLVVGVAMEQLRPAALSGSTVGGGGHGRFILGNRALGIPPMPTWAMVAVIVGWVVGWTGIGAWKMQTRDA
jgi:hypothetical protein